MTKREKRFYSLMNENGVIGVKEQDGYQIELDDITIYVYKDYYKSMMYFIDPDTGLSIHKIETVCNIEDIEEDDMDDIIATYRKVLKKAKRMKEYSLRKKVFREYKKARLFDEKCKSAIQDIQRKGRRV